MPYELMKCSMADAAQRGYSSGRGLDFSSLGSFTVDDDGDPIHPRWHRLTHPFQISTLRHGLAGLREASHNHHRSCAGEFSGWHRAGRVIELECKG